MASNNGSIPIMPPPAVPILGQPVEVRGWFLQVLLMCKCSQTPLLMIGQPGTLSVTCPECRKTYVLSGPKHLDLEIGVGVPTLVGDSAS